MPDSRSRGRPPNVIELVPTGPSPADVTVGQVGPVAGDGAHRLVVEACRLDRVGTVTVPLTRPLRPACRGRGRTRWQGEDVVPCARLGFSMACCTVVATARSLLW